MSKAGYVIRQARGGTQGHHCHWPGCTRRCPPAMWGCRTHWFMLPKDIQNEIFRAFRPGQEKDKRPSEEYLAAVKRAEAWILEHHPPTPKLI